jgi:hypothetical protein
MIFTAVSDWDWPLSTCGCMECSGEGFVQVWWDELELCDECEGIGVLFDWELIEEERRTL